MKLFEFFSACDDVVLSIVPYFGLYENKVGAKFLKLTERQFLPVCPTLAPYPSCIRHPAHGAVLRRVHKARPFACKTPLQELVLLVSAY